MPLTVTIADDHPLAINGLKNMLQEDPDIRIISEFETGESLLKGLEEQRPDVLLLDIHLPDINGMELAAIISKKHPEINILAITSYDTPAFVKAMIRNGCKGYILKNTRVNELKEAIKTVATGAVFIAHALKEQMLQNILQFKKQPGIQQPVLTKREKQVLQLIMEEYTSQEIADKLFLSLRTVENHRNSLLHKLKVKNSAGLVRAAIESGLLSI